MKFLRISKALAFGKTTIIVSHQKEEDDDLS